MKDGMELAAEKLERIQQERKEFWKAAWYECGRLLEKNKYYNDNYDQMTNTRVRIGFADITLMAFDNRFYDENGKYQEKLPKFIQNYYMKEVYYKDLNDKLTAKEREVLRLLVNGNNVATIAKKLKVSICTISKYFQELKKKYVVETVADLGNLMKKIL